MECLFLIWRQHKIKSNHIVNAAKETEAQTTQGTAYAKADPEAERRRQYQFRHSKEAQTSRSAAQARPLAHRLVDGFHDAPVQPLEQHVQPEQQRPVRS